MLPLAETVQGNLQNSGADETAINVVLWLLEHGRARGMNQVDLESFAKLGAGTLSKVFAGKYPTDIKGVVSRIEKARTAFLETQAQDERPIVPTWVLTETGKFCDAVRTDETIGILIGRSHSGKTTALEVYHAKHPRVVLMRMPVGGAARMFLQDLAEACKASSRGAYDQVRRSILKRFREKADDAPPLLIIDEAHETVIGRRVQTVTLELIRELHDVTGCPVVLCATPVFTASMEDERMRVFFEQLDNRAPFQRRLPNLAPMRDIDAIFAAYGLPPAPDQLLHPDDEKTPDAVVQDIRVKNGLGKLVKLVRKARRVARKNREKLSWSHVLDVVITGESWAAGDGPQDDEQDGKGGN